MIYNKENQANKTKNIYNSKVIIHQHLAILLPSI